MSALTNLLKYRYTKKTGKIEDDEKSSSQDSTESVQILEQSNTDPLVISETDSSQLESQKSTKEDERELAKAKKSNSLLSGYNDALLKRNLKQKVITLSHGRRRLDSDSSSDGDVVEDRQSDDEASSKRKLSSSFSQNDSEAAHVSDQQIKKRRRIQLLSESSDDMGTSSQETIPDSQIKNEKLSSLSERFPAASSERLETALKQRNYDVAQAAELILDEDEKQAGNGEQSNPLNGRSKKIDVDCYEVNSTDSESEQESSFSERSPILSFFDTASLHDLVSMPGCSQKKADAIISLRPFSSWDDLVSKFQNTKPLSYSLISRYWEIIQIRAEVLRLMKKCEELSEKLETMVSGLVDQTTDSQSESNLKSQPKILSPSLQMKPYQLVGLNWLRLLHTEHVNGILADEMGLGKTVQTISFLAHLLETGNEGPHIVIVPSSTVENWLREISTWCPELTVVLYYGSQEERRRLRKEVLYDDQCEYNILLTTYNMTYGSAEDRSLFKNLDFEYAVFDEGHMLKNMTSQRYQNLQKIRAERRLLLTGTPLQNNLVELMSLLCFVMPEMFIGKTESLKKMFTLMTKGDEGTGQAKYEKERIANAKNIMKPFVLRRLKKDVLNQMPAKLEKEEFVPLVPEQQILYDKLVETLSNKVLNNNDGAPSNAGSGMLMQLRKLANHALLSRNLFTDEKLKEMAVQISKEPSHADRGANPQFIQEDMELMSDYELHCLCKTYKKYLGEHILDDCYIEQSGKFRFLDKFLATKQKEESRVLLFSQFTMMLDIVEAYVKLKGYKYVRLDGQTPVVERQQMIDEYNKNTDIFLFLLSTRAGGLGINLTSANVVVLHDIDFNPYNDKQAEDRCHRLGQTKCVEVVKLISKGTVEEGMLSCAKYKLSLEKDITSNDTDEENPSDVLSLLKNALVPHVNHETT